MFISRKRAQAQEDLIKATQRLIEADQKYIDSLKRLVEIQNRENQLLSDLVALLKLTRW